MRSHFLKLLALLAVSGLCGCQLLRPKTAKTEPAEPATSAKKSFDPAARDNALALLDDLLNDEKNVSKILIIKRDTPELNRLIHNISQTAGNGAKRLKSLTKEDSRLHLSPTSLPPGEQATRKAMAKTKEQELLHTKGAEFEFLLLLTQSEALSYGAHLAQVAAHNEPENARAQEFSNLSVKLKTLHEQVLAMLRKGH